MTKKKQEKTSPLPVVQQNFPVVGIGASAGGLDAFKRFIKAIPENSGMAYVVVQHLEPSHESLLPVILSRETKIPVYEITDDVYLVPNHIYVIPSNKTIISSEGVLKLLPRDTKIQNLPIDIFFTSLAEVHQSLAVGVVLSGTAYDGTQGLKVIKEFGGITFAQDQQSAAYGSMPQSAVDAGVVDFILPPEEIPAQLLKINATYKSNHALKEEGEELPRDDENILKKIIFLLHQRSGADFTYYKQPTILRRIARRMALSKTEGLHDYLKILHDDKTEIDALFHDMLIPVTSFFRDSKTFEVLCETVFPSILKSKLASKEIDPKNESVRVWITGCSTGQEAYSIAICLHESLTLFGKKHSKTQDLGKIQIFASDLSEVAIKKARAGIYSKAELKEVSEIRLKNYFEKINGTYQVSRQIRDMCVFAPHNFLKDPPFAKMDLISCRNVLIYLDTFLQKKALTTFHYALKENGFLLLGKSETIGAASELFTSFSRNDKIYTRKSVPGRFMHVATERKEEVLAAKDNVLSARKETIHTDFRKDAEAIILSKYTPAGVIINEQMDIVHIHGSITTFLEPSPGKPTFNLLRMAREGLAFELRNALHKAKISQQTVSKEGISVGGMGKHDFVTIQVIPLKNTVEPHFLILFQKITMPSDSSRGKKGGVKSDEAKLRIEQLEKELVQTHEDMRSISEDQEAANEELQSANEELQSSNEEMQSLNEELETSKEELQSTNEELVIVNQELLDKQEQLNAAHVYADAIVSTVREPFIVLDKGFRIKLANTSFYKKFNLTEEETEGRVLYELQNRLWDNPVIHRLVEIILPEKSRIEDFEVKLEFPGLGERTMLVNAWQMTDAKTTERLILLAIEDITERKLAELQQKSFAEELEVKVNERTADLRQANLQLQQFSYIASHDLQEPLRKILTFSGRLQEKHKEGLPQDVKTYLNKIEGAAGRLRQLVQDLLDYSYVTTHEGLFAQTDLDQILKNILTDFELLIEQKKAKIDSDTLPVVKAIPIQMNQLFYNLMSNALKFSKENVPPVIKITSRMLSDEEIDKYPMLNPQVLYCEIVFRDNGIGFDQKYGQQIFTIFQRLHTKEAYTGTGIGLALCKKIAENHHGQIFAESKINEGAAFYVILPVQQPNF